jgi:hypothetical protein
MVVKMIIALIMTILVYMLQLNFKLFFTIPFLIPFLGNEINVIDLIMIAYFSYILSKTIETIIKGEKFVVDFHILLSFVIIMLLNSLNVMFAVVALYILFYYLAGYLLESKKILYFIIGLAIAIVIIIGQSYIIGLYNNIPEYLIQYIALFLILLSLLYNKLINEEFLLLVLILMFGPTNVLSLIVILIYYIFIAYNFIKKAV